MGEPVDFFFLSETSGLDPLTSTLGFKLVNTQEKRRSSKLGNDVENNNRRLLSHLAAPDCRDPKARPAHDPRRRVRYGARQFWVKEYCYVTARLGRRGLGTGDPLGLFWQVKQRVSSVPWEALQMDRKLRTRGRRDFIMVAESSLKHFMGQ